MSADNDLRPFLENIMRINVFSMGGASAGILGSTDGNNDIIDSLKRSAIIFAEDYRKQDRSQTKLAIHANEISGYIQVLNLTNTLSDSSAEAILDQLEKLMARSAV